MIKTRIIHYLLSCLGLALLLPPVSNSQEQEICLSCHQYPGLVRQENSDKLKVLHIDEQKYLASKHGKLRCQACHQGVDKIPHVGANKTSCQSSGCHQSKREAKQLANTPRKGFHRQQQSVITQLEDGSACKACHQIYPHKKEPFIRAFLNMHTSYLVCEVCHLKQDSTDQPVYRWIDAKRVVFQGNPFGSKYDPTHRRTHKPDTVLSRIAPFVMLKGQLDHSLINTRDTAGAILFQQRSQQLSPQQRKTRLAEFHRDVVKMASVKACEACHTDRGLLDFRRLGFSKERAENLRTMPIGNIIKKYDVFYLPKLGGM